MQTADNVENDANRRTEFTIVEVENRPAPANWQPTKMVLVAEGHTIVRHLDENGAVVREEVIADGEPAQPAPAADTAAPGG